MNEGKQNTNIQYNNMPLINSTNNLQESISLKYIDEFLIAEKEQNKKKSWDKLDMTVKLNKLSEWINNYTQEKNYNDSTKKELEIFIKTCLDKKRLVRGKDVNYDKDNQKVLGIPNIQFINRKFTLKRNESRVSTLKSLGTGAKNKTVKNITN